MKLNVRMCDDCGKEFRPDSADPHANNEIPFHIRSDREATGDIEKIYLLVDLCPACARKLLFELLKKLPVLDQNAITKRFKSTKYEYS
jgi:hypothetical protein